MQAQMGVGGELQRSYRVQDFASPGVIMRERSFIRPQSHHNMHHNQVIFTLFFFLENILRHSLLKWWKERCYRVKRVNKALYIDAANKMRECICDIVIAKSLIKKSSIVLLIIRLTWQNILRLFPQYRTKKKQN